MRVVASRLPGDLASSSTDRCFALSNLNGRRRAGRPDHRATDGARRPDGGR